MTASNAVDSVLEEVRLVLSEFARVASEHPDAGVGTLQRAAFGVLGARDETPGWVVGHTAGLLALALMKAFAVGDGVPAQLEGVRVAQHVVAGDAGWEKLTADLRASVERFIGPEGLDLKVASRRWRKLAGGVTPVVARSPDVPGAVRLAKPGSTDRLVI